MLLLFGHLHSFSVNRKQKTQFLNLKLFRGNKNPPYLRVVKQVTIIPNGKNNVIYEKDLDMWLKMEKWISQLRIMVLTDTPQNKNNHPPVCTFQLLGIQ